ncbi:hypothetical protein BZK35_15495 [Escherichia coli]|uniref:hypothetical protein n=1 Tax=Escherichia coli TaxID=562 RepID=UPI000A3C7243|nr:hypothetical protein [Escherichia coli]OUJ66921.1 hypothetical protein BZK35_15495 [Escherichia coli]
MRISLPVWSQPGYELQLMQIKKLSWKASRNEEDCRVLTVKSNRKWHWLLERENPRTLQVCT